MCSHQDAAGRTAGRTYMRAPSVGRHISPSSNLGGPDGSLFGRRRTPGVSPHGERVLGRVMSPCNVWHVETCTVSFHGDVCLGTAISQYIALCVASCVSRHAVSVGQYIMVTTRSEVHWEPPYVSKTSGFATRHSFSLPDVESRDMSSCGTCAGCACSSAGMQRQGRMRAPAAQRPSGQSRWRARTHWCGMAGRALRGACGMHLHKSVAFRFRPGCNTS